MRKLNGNICVASIRMICIACIITLSIARAFSQIDVASASRLPEKIYLQLDGKVYTTDQTIWFKAIVTDTDHVPTSLSGVLHVELIGPDERVLDNKLLKLENGMANGAIELFQNYEAGRYLVRAYTQWNRNFDHDFMCQEYIDVFPASGLSRLLPIDDVTLIEKSPGKFSIQAWLKPSLLDSLHKGDLTVNLKLDEKKDSVVIKKSAIGSYFMDYEIPPNSRMGVMSIKTMNSESFTKTFAVDTSTIDLQFFPEGGVLVNGSTSRVGFKAINYLGKGQPVEGDIVDMANRVITSFKSNALGMGSFFVKPDSGITYFARLTSLKSLAAVKYPLPMIKSKGSVITIRKIGDSFRIAVASNDVATDEIYLRVSCREKEYQFLPCKINRGVFLLDLDAKQLPEGIITVSLLNRDRMPIAERIFFNEREIERLDIEISPSATIFSQREKITIEVSATGTTGLGTSANLSVLVINKAQLGAIQSTRENIVSRFLLSSDLKGEVENPGYYFRKENESRLADLDVLMLTQGWRKYNYPDSVFFQPEYNLGVSGSVGGVFSKENKKDGVELTMLTFGNNKSAYVQKTDSLGRFHFNVNDAYGEKLNFIIQTASKKGVKKDYQILLDENKSPRVDYHHQPDAIDSVVSLVVEKNQERKLIEDANRLSGVNYLDVVNVKAARLIPEREKVTELYGEADVRIDGEQIRAKEEKWSYGLYSVLMFNFPDQVNIRRLGNGSFLHASIYNGGPTVVVIDGIPVISWDYRFIPEISPNEVRSFEIIKWAKNFPRVFREAFPEVHPWDIPLNGSIIAIYTFAGKGLQGTKKAVGISKMSIPVFAPVREFYAPKYEKLTPEDWNKPDMRGLIHWQPQVKTDHAGNAEVSFYNADVTGEMLVVVEAIAADGSIGYQEMTYKVKKRE